MTSVAPLRRVTQQEWSACVGGSSVALYLIHGAHHVWPPRGPGAPNEYSASAAVWAFLSAHRAASRSLSASEASVSSVRGRLAGTQLRIRATVRAAEPVTISAMLAPLATGTRAKNIRLTRPGVHTISLDWTLPAGASIGAYSLSLLLRDRYGRTRRVITPLAP
jgi:hypothetical protein